MSVDAKKPSVKDPGWKDLAIGGIIPKAGTSAEYKTGDWRTQRPIHDSEKCINCLICWVYCPDSSILVEDGKIVGVNYDHCKGCGLCAEECPPKVKAFTMVPESEFREK